MNRRGFLGTFLASATAALVAPTIFAPMAADRFRWKRSANGIWVINTEWEHAPYEIVVSTIISSETGKNLCHIVDRKKGVQFEEGSVFHEDFPIRLKNQKFINPFIFVPT